MFSMSCRSSPGGRKGVWSSVIMPFSAGPSGEFVRFRMSGFANLVCESGSTAPRFNCLILLDLMACYKACADRTDNSPKNPATVMRL